MPNIPLKSVEYRAPEPGDPAARSAVLEITRTAFLINPETGRRIEGDTPDELPMVQALLDRGAVHSLHTASVDGAIAGYVLYAEGSLTGNAGARVLGLTIMGVATALQRRGIGTGLLKWSVAKLAGACDALFVVGHPRFYPKAGFAPCSRWGITFTFPAPPEVCMLLPLSSRELQPGVASFHPIVHEFVKL